MGKIVISDKKNADDRLRLSLSKNRKKASITAGLFKYRDKDTRQIVLYIPSLDITGYGSDEEKAMEMINFSIDQFFRWITTLPNKQVEMELKRLGWKHVLYKNKEYSQTYVDGDGKLTNFNAVADEVERLTVVA